MPIVADFARVAQRVGDDRANARRRTPRSAQHSRQGAAPPAPTMTGAEAPVDHVSCPGGPPAQVPRESSMPRILPIAFVGLRPFGHTDTQFMMPRQRNTLNGSSSFASRSSVAVSRLSARKR